MHCESIQCAWLVNKAGREGGALPSLGPTVGMKHHVFRYGNNLNFRVMAALVYFTLIVYRQGLVLSGHHSLSLLQPSEGDDVTTLFQDGKTKDEKVKSFYQYKVTEQAGIQPLFISLQHPNTSRPQFPFHPTELIIRLVWGSRCYIGDVIGWKIIKNKK